ncbi:MAG: hypothetical protein WKF84_29895 [Pyrinomonadaceae bacterium]
MQIYAGMAIAGRREEACEVLILLGEGVYYFGPSFVAARERCRPNCGA